MELTIHVDTTNKRKIVIEDNSNYLAEDQNSFQKGAFKKSDTTSLVLLQLNKIENSSIVLQNVGYEIPVEFDGWFTVNYLVLPTKEWFVRMLSSQEQSRLLEVYEYVYYINNSLIYKYIPATGDIVPVIDVQELLEINPSITTISKTSKDYVSICFLLKCYINLCQQIFEERGFSQCWSKNSIDSELIYKRDLVWMALNIIKYMVECNQLYEAERIIELLHSCNGVCGDKKSSSSGNGCGCS